MYTSKKGDSLFRRNLAVENPNKSFRHSLLMIAFGIAIGGIPGLIQVDQMRRQLQADTAQAQKLTDQARK